MSKPAPVPTLRLRGVRHNNLKNFALDLPLRRLIVVTGLSGSGKSSLAFDTLFAEGQRRYIETFSPYARQFFDRMDKPQVDSIEGIPPAIAIEQRNAVRTTRSTIGTMTEICDYLKVMWPHLTQLHCRGCGQPVRKEAPQTIWQTLSQETGAPDTERLITFDLPLAEKLSLAESLALIAKQGYQRILQAGAIVRIEDAAASKPKAAPAVTSLTVVQDRLKLNKPNRARFIEACEQAYHFGKGKLKLWQLEPPATAVNPRPFSNRRHCARCDLDYREPSPALFSFNHPVGACPACKGFGRVISIDYELAVPDRSLSLTDGAVKPWRGGFSAECQGDLRKFCQRRGVPMNVPFRELPPPQQDWVLSGDPDYGTDEAHQWPRAWYGVKGYFKWLESKAYKMHVRVLLSRYRAYSQCPACGGARLQPDALLYRLATGPVPRQANAGATIAELPRPAGLSLADFYALPVDRALAVVQEVGAASGAAAGQAHSSIAIVLEEIRTRLSYLVQVGLGYLTLDRPTRTLSGGETERVNLTTCLGTRLVNTLFVLDEPSVGLHPRDTARLVGILERLRDTGNSVIVVEHEASVMRAADQIVDLGPGHGATGGEVIFQGPFREILKSAASLTGQYLSGRRRIEIPERRAVGSFVFLADRLTDHEPIGGASSTSPALQLNSGLRGTPSSEVRFMGSPQSEIPNPKGRKGSVPKQVRESTTDATPHSALRTPHLNWLTVEHATRHNLRDLSVALPLNRFVCLTGVSGSGKTTFAREVLLPALQERLETARPTAKACDRLDSATEPETEGDAETDSATRLTHCLTGAEHLARVLLVDQAALGKTPRSNPAVYVGAFEDIREVFAQTEAARQRGLNASAFSFNSAQGQCERCRGAGFEKIEMQFLSDVFIRCPDCGGRRYRQHILEVRVQPPASKVRAPKSDLPGHPGPRRRAAEGLSIADLLEATVDEALEFLAGFAGSKPAARACAALRLLQDVGLGYLHLGQPINTLSGGESQRLKLAAHLAEATQGRTSVAPVPVAIYEATPPEGPGEDGGRRDACPTLFIFDEPTTGLHFDDIRVLLEVFQRLVRNGHSVLVIEHNLEVIKCADWVIDLGPEAGEGGGQLVAAGTPEQIAACAASHTGQFLRTVLNPAST